MKKLFSVLLVALLAFSLVGCGNETSTEEDANVTSDSYDVIVVGAGGSGLTAAIAAKEAGANVVVFEKMGIIGGNTAVSGGEMAAPGNWLQVAEGTEDSTDKFFEDIMNGGDNIADESLVRVLADNALDAANWLKDEIHVPFEDYMMFFGGHSVSRSLVPAKATGSTITTSLKTKCDDLGIEIKTNHDVKELLVDEAGKVTGVKVESEDGVEEVNAKSVILASGGFGSNIEMRKQYNPSMDEKISSTCTAGSTGDGIVMAQAVGAGVRDMEYIQTYPTCDVDNGLLLYVGDVRLVKHAIMVNKEGKRFIEELGRRDDLSFAITEQTGGVCYLVFDQEGLDAADIMDNHSAEYDSLIKRGRLVKADSLEEAAAHFEIDYDTLKETVDNWNKYCDEGADPEFNYRGTLNKISEEGPIYILTATPSVHHTMGGLTINSDAQVLNTEGEAIEGLFACGEVTGGIHGTNRLGSDAIAECIVFGRVAGQNAAK